MTHSIITPDTRARQRFAHLLREAALHANDTDYAVIQRVQAAANTGTITIRDAHACLVALRAQQRGLAA